MSTSFNKVILVGNVTRDPELRSVGAKNTSLVETGLAVNNRVKKGDQWVDEPCFIDCVFWGRKAEVLNAYARQGTSLLVEGKLKMEQWEQEGRKRTKFKIDAWEFQLLGSRNENAARPAPTQPVVHNPPAQNPATVFVEPQQQPQQPAAHPAPQQPWQQPAAPQQAPPNQPSEGYPNEAPF